MLKNISCKDASPGKMIVCIKCCNNYFQIFSLRLCASAPLREMILLKEWH